MFAGVNKLICLLVLGTCSLGWGFSIVQDSPDHLIFEESVGSPQIKKCNSGILVSAPTSRILGSYDSPAAPYMTYTVAIPSGLNQPRVSIQDISDTLIHGELSSIFSCSDPSRKMKSESHFAPLFLGPAVDRDGVRRIMVGIPLLQKSGSGLLYRKHFRVEVSWPRGGDSKQGGAPGKRALSQVINPIAAKAFFQGSPRKALKRSTADVAHGIEWILRIPIGDRDIATFEEDGVYALSYSQMRSRLNGTGLYDRIDGIRVGSLTVAAGNPDTLHDSPQTKIPETGPLKEQPIHVLDHGGPGNVAPDGIWNDGDTLLFFATGTSLWKPSGNPTMPFYFASNVYSFTRNFYLGVRSDQAAPRLEMVSNTSGGNSVTSIVRYLRAEKDLTLRDTYFGYVFGEFDESSGREWFWIWGDTYKDSLVVPPSEITLPHLKSLPGILPNTSANIAVGFFPHRGLYAGIEDKQGSPWLFSDASEDALFANVRFRFHVNGEEAQITNTRLAGGQFILSTEAATASNNQFELHILPNQNQFDRFDGYSLSYQSLFSWNGSKESWPIAPTAGRQRFTVQGAPQDLRALRIANGIPGTVYSLQNGSFSDSLSLLEYVNYHLFRWGAWNTIADSLLIAMEEPVSGSIADASQLSGNFDYVVICPKEWVPAALRIKALRESANVSGKTRTAIVDLDQIWMHYGSGFPSPHGIRDFLRYARHQWPDLRQALLVGDGHPDYRRIRQSSGGMPVIPPFEVNDLGSDDFFAILDSGEVFPFGNYDLDLAIGRLPVNSLAELETYLRKMEEYEALQKQDLGLWRNTLLLAADDAMQRDLSDGIPGHTEQTERISGILKQGSELSGYPINIQRLYLLNYEADMSYEKPNAALDLIAKINQGALFTVYFGHGSATDWADEGLLRPYMIQSVDNTGRYTIIGSFACTVGRFDLATTSSLSEVFLRAEGKGAIASIGAMRESFPGDNEVFATDLLKSAFLDSAGTLGQAYWHGKGTGFSGHSDGRYNHARYVLLGEPALLMPNTKGNVTFDSAIDTIQALDQMKMSGNVEGMATTGKLFVEVVEGVNRKRLIQERPNSDAYEIDVDYQGRVIHSEIMEYKDGKFHLEFLTPRKLNFGDTAAQVRVWAWSATDARVGRGLVKNIVLNGTSPNAASIVDTIPPQVHFRPCGFPDSLARDYSAGTTVRMEIPACLEVMIDDSLGLDLQEQPDEGISFEILGYKDPWHPSPFLEQSGKRVMTRLRFNSAYKVGYYTLRVAAQDKLGNRTQRDIRMELQGTLKQAITGVFNAPNPVGKNGTTFYFRNLAENHTSAVAIEIFGVDGRLVKVIQNAKSGITRWDGRDQRGRLLANGLYHYVVTGTVYSDGKARRFKAKQKLVISR